MQKDPTKHMNREEINKVVSFLNNCEDVVRCGYCLDCKCVRSKYGDRYYCGKFIDKKTGNPIQVTYDDYCSFGSDNGLPF